MRFTDMPFGHVPVLEVDGTRVAGSMNILRYLGRKYGKLHAGVVDLEGSIDRRLEVGRLIA